jgi:hypothetical protein
MEFGGKGSPFEVLGRSESDLRSSDRAGGQDVKGALMSEVN